MIVTTLATIADVPSRISMPWWANFLVFAAALLAANAIGFRLGRREGSEERSERASLVSVPVAALLALLGLMLAFAFTIAEGRYAMRKNLVLQDANAIGTTWLRAKTLPETHSARIQSLLREYVDVRLHARDESELERALARSAKLQSELWDEAAELARAHPDSVIVGVFLLSLNEMIDLHESRVTVGLYQRLPRPILWTVGTVSVFAVGLLGYGAGLGRWRAVMPTIAVIVSVASVLVLVVELDRPLGGILQVNQGAMNDLRETIEASMGDQPEPRTALLRHAAWASEPSTNASNAAAGK